jgi:uncharacterized membrane protein YdjX (TVP38/TMEM64 family)
MHMAVSDETGTDRVGVGRRGLRFVPLAVIALVLLVALAGGAQRYMSITTIVEHKAELLAWVRGHEVAAPLLFTMLFAISVACSVPVFAVFAVLSGYLFGYPGAFYTLVGSTLGAAGVHLAARGAIGDWLLRRAGPLVGKLAAGFRRDAFFYLLAIRLAAVFPFFVVNLVPATVGMRLAPFMIATAIGMIPMSLVFAILGRGLDAVFAAGGAPDLGSVLEPHILAPMLLAAALSLLPIALRRLMARRVR